MVPGWHIENNENSVEWAIREVKEETWVDIKLFSFIHKKHKVSDAKWLLPAEYYYEQIIPWNKKEEEHCHLDFTYLAFASNWELKINLRETKDLKWIELDKSLTLDTFDWTKYIINDLISKLDSETILYEEK